MIEVDHLSKRYGKRFALDDVSFRVRSGAVTAFVGPNGSGKTTTMRIILGLDRATSGRALINGKEFRDYPDPICQVGALLDTKFAHPQRSAYDHLLIVAETHGISRSRVHEVMEETGIESVARERVGKFSLGMTQRLGIATALLGSPRILILDEPINGLDVDGVVWFRQLCRQYAEAGSAVFLSSHVMSEIEQTADRVIILGQGRVIKDAELAELRQTHRLVDVTAEKSNQLIEALESHGATISHRNGDNFTAKDISAADIGRVSLETGIVLEHLAEREQSLEDSYQELTAASGEFRARAPIGQGQ